MLLVVRYARKKTGLCIRQDGDSNVNHEIENFQEIIFHAIIFFDRTQRQPNHGDTLFSRAYKP